MSTQEIIAELATLNHEELQLVRQKLTEMEISDAREPQTKWGKALMEIAGSVQNLPTDLSSNHDHYLYGTEKRK